MSLVTVNVVPASLPSSGSPYKVWFQSTPVLGLCPTWKVPPRGGLSLCLKSVREDRWCIGSLDFLPQLLIPGTVSKLGSGALVLSCEKLLLLFNLAKHVWLPHSGLCRIDVTLLTSVGEGGIQSEFAHYQRNGDPVV